MTKFKVSLILFFVAFLMNKTFSQTSYAQNLYGLGMQLYFVARDDLKLIEFPKHLDTSILENKIRHKIFIEQQRKLLQKSNLIFNNVVKKYPESKYAMESLNMIGGNLMIIGDTAEAIKIFHKIISNDFEEHQRDSMASSRKYFPIKRSAYYSLTNYHIERKDYETAQKYFEQVKKHPNRHWCGNGAARDRMHMDYTEAIIINGIYGREKAIEFLIPKSLSNSLTNNQKLVVLTGKLLTQTESRNDVLNEYLNSAKNYSIRQTKYFDNAVFIKFREIDIQMPYSIDFDKEDIENQIKKYLEKSPLGEYLKN